jgi:hypothetical protein
MEISRWRKPPDPNDKWEKPRQGRWNDAYGSGAPAGALHFQYFVPVACAIG